MKAVSWTVWLETQKKKPYIHTHIHTHTYTHKHIHTYGRTKVIPLTVFFFAVTDIVNFALTILATGACIEEIKTKVMSSFT